jgi:hypothetical protein
MENQPKFARKFNNRLYLLMLSFGVFDSFSVARQKKWELEDLGKNKIKIHSEHNKYYLYKMK